MAKTEQEQEKEVTDAPNGHFLSLESLLKAEEQVQDADERASMEQVPHINPVYLRPETHCAVDRCST